MEKVIEGNFYGYSCRCVFCDNGKDGEERDWCWGFVNFYFLGMKG